MRNKNTGKVIALASVFALGLAAIPHTVTAGEEVGKRGSMSEQGSATTSQTDRQTGKKSNSSAGQSGSGQSNAAPDEWEKAKGKGQKKKGGGSTGGDTGMGSSSSQGSSTSGTSSGSGGY
jgi:hypothetical protein